MSKHSIRRGSAGSAERRAQRLERVVVRRVALVEARLVGERGVSGGQLEQARASRRAAARAGARAGRRAPTATLSSASASASSSRQMDLRRAPRSPRRTAAAPPPAPRASSAAPTAASPPLGHRARRARRRGRGAPGRPGSTPPAGPTFRPKTSRSPSSAVAIFCWRSRSVSTVRMASRSCAACSNRSAAAASAIRSRSVVDQLVVPALEEQLRVGRPPRRTPRASRSSSTHGAMQRLMSYSRHGRPRCPVITSLHDRIPNSRCVRRHRPSREGGRQERARRRSGRRARRGARRARAGTLRSVVSCR